MATQTESSITVVDDAPAVVPDRRHGHPGPDTKPTHDTDAPRPAAGRPSRRQRWVVAGTAALCLTVGAASGVVVAQRWGSSTPSAGSAGATQVDDLGDVLHGTSGHLVDGHGTAVGPRPASAPSGPAPTPDLGDVVHGTRGNLVSGDGRSVDSGPRSRSAGPGAAPAGRNSPSTAKLSAIGWS